MFDLPLDGLLIKADQAIGAFGGVLSFGLTTKFRESFLKDAPRLDPNSLEYRLGAVSGLGVSLLTANAAAAQFTLGSLALNGAKAYGSVATAVAVGGSANNIAKGEGSTLDFATVIFGAKGLVNSGLGNANIAGKVGNGGSSGSASQSIGQGIAGGHAFEKHILNKGEFSGWIRTRQQFSNHIDGIVTNPSSSKNLDRGRSAYWDNVSGTVVIRDPKSPDGGTAFQPKNGKVYYDNLR